MVLLGSGYISVRYHDLTAIVGLKILSLHIFLASFTQFLPSLSKFSLSHSLTLSLSHFFLSRFNVVSLPAGE